MAGDGQQIDRTQADLNEITNTFNQNFHLIHHDEEMLRLKLNQLINNENTLSKQETVLFHKLQILEIDSHQQARKWDYEQRRNLQIESLLNMIQNSILRQTIRHLHLGLQKDQENHRECQINRCILHIRVSHRKNEREVELKTTWGEEKARNRAKVTCSPILVKDMNNTNNLNKTILISKLHKTTQDSCFYLTQENPTKTKKHQNDKLCNSSFWNDDLRLASNTDFDLPDVILTRTDVMIRVHCTENMDLMLNNQRKSCSIVKHIEINNITDFEIQNENKTSKISAHTISQEWTDKMDNVFNSETDMLDKPDILTKTPQETIINSFGNLFMLEDGKPHKVNIAVSGITIIILTLLITGLLCFWKKHPTCALQED